MRHVRPRSTAAVLGLVSVLLLAPIVDPAEAQRRNKSKEAPTFDDVTTVTVVEVPVQVTVKGEPMRQLSRDDFEVYEGRQQQRIVGFEVVDLSTTTEATSEVPAAARRHFLALFDLGTTDLKAIERAQQAVADLMVSEMHPTDLMAVATYSINRGVQLVLNFTSDRNQIHQAISTLGFGEQKARVNDPLGLVIADLDGPSTTVPVGGIGAQIAAEEARGGGATATLKARDRRAQQTQDLMRLLGELTGVANMMASIEGRKHLLFLSEGFDSSVLVGTRGVSNEDQQAMMDAAEARRAGEIWNADEGAAYGDNQARSAMNAMAEVFRRANTTIQAIDIGGLVAGASNPNQEGLFMMANETGGNLYNNTNDLGGAMEEFLTRNSVTYLLAYQPADYRPDGEFHEIEVKVKADLPRGAEVTHRPGYIAKPFDQQNPLERVLQTGQTVVAGRTGGAVGVDVLATSFLFGDDKAYVPVLIEARGPDLLKGLEQPQLPIELYAYAMDEEGTVRDFFVRSVGIEVAQVKPTLERSGFKYWGHFDLAPGSYTVRVLLRNAVTGQGGLQVATVTVPAASGGEPLLQPTLVGEPFDRFVVLREEESEQRKDIPFPFMRQDQPFLPSARPTLAPGESQAVTLLARNLGEGSLTLDAQLLDLQGQPAEASVDLQGTAQAPDGAIQLEATLQPGRVAAGDYTLLVTAKNLATGAEATSTIPVRIEG